MKWIKRYKIGKHHSLVQDDRGQIILINDTIKLIKKVHEMQGSREEDRKSLKTNEEKEAFFHGYSCRGFDLVGALTKILREGDLKKENKKPQ